MQEHTTIRHDECWLFAGQINPGGYGIIRYTENYIHKSLSAHRLTYEKFVSKIPDKLVLDHLCRVRSCINPSHLEPVTQKINVNRGLRANSLKTQCIHGHPFDEINTRMYRGGRNCRTCAKLYMRTYKKKQGV